MKNFLILFITLFIAILAYWFGFRESSEQKFNNEIQREMSGNGRYTFEGPDGNRYRYWALSDLMIAAPYADVIMQEQLKVVARMNEPDSTEDMSTQYNLMNNNSEYDSLYCHNSSGNAFLDCICSCKDSYNSCVVSCGNIYDKSNPKCQIISFWEGMAKCKIINDLYGSTINSINLEPFQGSRFGEIGLTIGRPEITLFGSNRIQEINLGICGNKPFSRGLYQLKLEVEGSGVSPIELRIPMLLAQ